MARPSPRRVPSGLVFTTDELPGYSRRKCGRGFSYSLPDGALLRCRKEKKRIASLAVPPAYTGVWICMDRRGHLQATGLDDDGRKQYRYHPDWHAHAADLKFGLLPCFAAALPSIRAACSKLLKESGLGRERVIAGVVSLLDRTGYRIGNSRYEKANRSYGLASLLTRHVREDGDAFEIKFRGKSGKEHFTEISDPRLSELVSELQELPGQHLFRYEDEEGDFHDIGTSEINGWIKETSGGDFTAKQFRTWKATVTCATKLKTAPPPETKAALSKAENEAIRATATLLNHTPATCRKYYIHPTLLTAFRNGDLFRIMNAKPPRLRKSDSSAKLHAVERRVLKIIGRGG